MCKYKNMLTNKKLIGLVVNWFFLSLSSIVNQTLMLGCSRCGRKMWPDLVVAAFALLICAFVLTCRLRAHSPEDPDRQGGDDILRHPRHPAHAAVPLQHRGRHGFVFQVKIR